MHDLRNETPATSSNPTAEFDALQTVIEALQSLDPETRLRIFEAAATFLRIGSSPGGRALSAPSQEGSSARTSYPSFSEDTSMSPKEFLLEKQPKTDVERIACLAYYLTHYRDMPHFKTLDLSKLNTEAAQPKFSNTANAANNAVKTRYLVSSSKGHRQLSAAAEQFVLALPDRESAKAAMAATRPRRRNKRTQPTRNATKG